MTQTARFSPCNASGNFLGTFPTGHIPIILCVSNIHKALCSLGQSSWQRNACFTGLPYEISYHDHQLLTREPVAPQKAHFLWKAGALVLKNQHKSGSNNAFSSQCSWLTKELPLTVSGPI